MCDPERERPRDFRELISGDASWEELGLKIAWTEPLVPGEERFPIKTPLRLGLGVDVKQDSNLKPENVTAWAWTPIVTENNREGIWKEIKLTFDPKSSTKIQYVYQTYVFPEKDDHYRITFNVKTGKTMVWSNLFRRDNIIDLEASPQKKMAKSEVERCMNWLFQQQGDMESAAFGEGQFSVLEALAIQQAKVKDITKYRDNIDTVLKSENVDSESADQLHGSYQSVKALSEKRRSCLDIVNQIASLEDFVQNLSNEFDDRSVHLVNSGIVDCQKGGPTQSNESLARTAQKCIMSVRRNWRWIFQVMQCAEVHLRNDAAYQEYFQEVSESEYWMNTTLSRIHLSFNKTNLIGNRSDAEAMLKEIRDVLAAYLQWQTKIDYLFDRAKEVVPVPQRINKLSEPRPVIALTDFTTKEIEFIEGEALMLLDNSDRKVWKVKNHRGQIGEVPAIVILIPAPSGPALDAAVRLRLQLLALWTMSVKRLGYQMIAFMLLVFRDWTSEEVALLQAMAATDKEALLKILAHIEATLVTHWQGYGDFEELQERLTRLKTILEEVQTVNGHANGVNGDENFTNNIVVQVKTLEDLLNKYKDFWTFWETFKSVVEMLKQPKFMLVCDKWEQLRFVTSAHFVKFWDTELDLAQEDLIKAEGSVVLQEAAKQAMPVSSEVTIEEEKEETTTDTITTSLEEEQHTFVITGVIDPNNEKRTLKLEEAVASGILDQVNRKYVNPRTGQSMTIGEAMGMGKVTMEVVSTKKLREEKNTYGLITIRITKESRPYTITGVRDPVSEEVLTVTQAAKKSILDTASSTYKTETGEKMSIADAIHSGLVLVEYHEGEDHHKPEVVTKTYSVHGVVDQKKKKKVSFADAVRDGLLDKDTGEYVNNSTGQKVGVHEAIMRGFIKARVVTDPSKLEIDPENHVIVEKLEHAKTKLLRSVKAINAFKSASKH